MKLDSSVGCFIILLSIFGGFLIGESLLHASGLLTMTSQVTVQEFRVGAWIGCVVFGSALILFGVRSLLYLSMVVIDRLERVQAKPKALFAFALILSGTICLLGVIGLEVATIILAFPPSRAHVHVNGIVAEGNVGLTTANGHPFAIRVLAHLFASLVFVAGCSSLALGVWSAIPVNTVPGANSKNA
jgi:hypothetical protein